MLLAYSSSTENTASFWRKKYETLKILISFPKEPKHGKTFHYMLLSLIGSQFVLIGYRKNLIIIRTEFSFLLNCIGFQHLTSSRSPFFLIRSLLPPPPPSPQHPPLLLFFPRSLLSVPNEKKYDPSLSRAFFLCNG